MLKIYDNINPETAFNFRLSNILFDNQWTYYLNSNEQPYFTLEFEIPYNQNSFHENYSTSVYLLKNKYFAQKDVIEIRVNESAPDHGRIGYIFQLNSIFDPQILNINKHLFSYIYYALGNIFYNQDFKQTKSPTFVKTTFEISDFFDDDILLLVICDQIVAAIPDFNIESYLPSLYKNGFYWYEPNRNFEFYNESQKIEDNYKDLASTANKFNYYSLRLDKICNELSNDNYIYTIFKKQLLLKNDPETRFLILYQVIEILISKILTYELNKRVCNATNPILSYDLKGLLGELAKESKRISLLMSNPYTHIPIDIGNNLKSEIYSLLNSLAIPEYAAVYDPATVVIQEVFYDYRNNLLHNHRIFKSPLLNEATINNQMKNINSLTELTVIEILNSFTP